MPELAVGELRDLPGDRGRLVLLKEVLGRHGVDLIEPRGAPGLLAVDAQRKCRVVGCPDDLTG
jgi:hypothetical protein